jgi:hypothetical protein
VVHWTSQTVGVRMLGWVGSGTPPDRRDDRGTLAPSRGPGLRSRAPHRIPFQPVRAGRWRRSARTRSACCRR